MSLPIRVSLEAVVDLRLKYVEMLAMRLADAAGEDPPGQIRARMKQLAERFPGALREIDRLPLDEIARRIDALDAATAQMRAVEAWMEAIALYHALMRGALVIKRWLAGRKRVDEAVMVECARALAGLPFPEDSSDWLPHLAAIASPPNGRLSSAVFARMAVTLGASETAVRRLVFSDGG